MPNCLDADLHSAYCADCGSALSAVDWKLTMGSWKRTQCESREVFGGPLAYVIQGLYGPGLQKCLDAQGIALKGLLGG